MHLDRGIVHTDRGSDGLWKIPDDPNTLTSQSYSTYDSPREPIHGHVT